MLHLRSRGHLRDICIPWAALKLRACALLLTCTSHALRSKRGAPSVAHTCTWICSDHVQGQTFGEIFCGCCTSTYQSLCRSSQDLLRSSEAFQPRPAKCAQVECDIQFVAKECAISMVYSCTCCASLALLQRCLEQLLDSCGTRCGADASS